MATKKKEPTKLPDNETTQDEAKAAELAAELAADQAADQGAELGADQGADQGAELEKPDPARDVSADIPEVMVLDAAEPLPKKAPWVVVEELSDNDMLVEAANIQAHGRSHMLLRFRIDGRLTGAIKTIDRMHYKPGSKRTPFVTR